MSWIRRASWTAGTPVRAVLIVAIRAYRATLSGWLGGQCRFFPTCSHYAEDAIRSRGAGAGTALAAWRILRCNPFGAGGVDPAPQPRSWRPSPGAVPVVYDSVVREREATRA